MSKLRSRLLWAFSITLIFAFLISACAPSAPTVVTQVVTQPAQVVTQLVTQPAQVVTQEVQVTHDVQVTAVPAALPYGLKPGMPYKGTTLKLLNCCLAAAQFYLQNQKSVAFTALTGIKVEWGDEPWTEFQTETQQEGVTGAKGWDLVAWVDTWGPGLYKTVMPLDDLIKRDNYDIKDFPEAYLAPGRNADGKTVGIPFRGHAFTLFYRKDVFDKLGLKAPTTWKEMEDDAALIQSKTTLKGLAAYYGINGGQNLFIWQSLLWSNGGDLWDKDYNVTFNNPAGLEATQRYIDWYRTQKITPSGSATFTEPDSSSDFAQGRSAMWIGWSWYYGNYINKTIVAPEVLGNVAFAPVPGWEGKGTPATYAYIWEVGIFQNSKNKDAAWEYLKFMTSPEVEKMVVMDKTAPQYNNVVVVHKSNMQDAEVNKLHNGLQQNMWSILQNARSLPMVTDYLEIQSVLETDINDMANGKDVKPTLDKMAADVQSILKRDGYSK